MKKAPHGGGATEHGGETGTHILHDAQPPCTRSPKPKLVETFQAAANGDREVQKRINHGLPNVFVCSLRSSERPNPPRDPEREQRNFLDLRGTERYLNAINRYSERLLERSWV